MHIDEGANVQLCQSVRGQMSLHAIFGQGANVRGGTCPTLTKTTTCFLKADKTPHAQKYNVDKTPHADFKIRTKPPSCFCSVDKQMEADCSKHPNANNMHFLVLISLLFPSFNSM